MTSAAAWLAEFDQRGAQFRAERAAYHEHVAAMIDAERAGVAKVAPAPVVLTSGREIDVEDAPASARRVVAAANAAGWATRLVGSVAADPGRGIAEVVTVRVRRHDERLWAAWRNGAFDVAWYVGPSGLERVGWARLPRTKRRGVLDVIEGVRGPAQWVDLLERQEVERVVGLISAAFPGLSLTRQ